MEPALVKAAAAARITAAVVVFGVGMRWVQYTRAEPEPVLQNGIPHKSKFPDPEPGARRDSWPFAITTGF